MAKTPSAMVPLGSECPNFQLPDVVSGELVSRDQLLAGKKALVVMFICNHCPFVKHIQQELVKLANDYMPLGVSFVAINSNDVENYPEDSPDKMKEVALAFKYPFPYLYDETQEVAKAFNAQCTPDFFLYDQDLKLIYRGQLDDSRPGNNIPVTGVDLREALDSFLQGKEVSQDQKPSIGCNIKWKER